MLKKFFMMIKDVKKYIRTFATVLLLFVFTAPASTSVPVYLAALPSSKTFTFSGRGWGHGVGMCQYGAYGQAKAGKKYNEILAYYYRGTKISKVNTSVALKVEVSNNQSTVKITASGGFDIYNSDKKIATSSANKVWSVTQTSDEKFRLKDPDSDTIGTYSGSIVFKPKSGSILKLVNNGRMYRGFLAVASADNSLTLSRVINHVMFQDYLYGMAEVPYSWPLESLKTQVVAARSYAYRKKLSPVHKLFHMWSDVRSQVYLGYNQETRSYAANWKEAVNDTKDIVATYNGNIISTYYFSTCGGSTENSEDVWTAALPYLRATKCNWCSSSPKYSWKFTYTVSEIQSKLNTSTATKVLGSLSGLEIRDRRGPRRVSLVRIKGTSGIKDITGSQFRQALGLNSTWFWFADIKLSGVKVSPTLFSPNRDKVNDVTRFYLTIDRPAYIAIRVYNSRGEVRTVVKDSRARSKGSYTVGWNGTNSSGKILPDGTYRYVVYATNSQGTVQSGGYVIVRARPTVSGVRSNPNPFSPNGDGKEDISYLNYKLDTWAYVTVQVRSASGVVRTIINGAKRNAGARAEKFNGKNNSGSLLANGNYKFVVTARNSFGSSSAASYVRISR